MENTIDQALDALVTNEDVTYAKPAPDIYLAIASKLGVETSQILVVEDHPVGVASATDAGCHVVQVHGVDEVTVSLLEEALKRYVAEASAS